MEPNDFWTHIGLVTFSFLVVVGPRLLSPDHVVNTLIFLIGGLVIIIAAIIFYSHTNSHANPLGPASRNES